MTSKLDELEKHFGEKLRGFTLQEKGQDKLTGNYFLRFRRQNDRLRLEFRQVVFEDQSVEEIATRWEADWSGANKGESAFRDYGDRIVEVPWDLSSP